MKLIDLIKQIPLRSAAAASVSAKKTITDIGREVIAGEWGSGDARKAALQKAGYNYEQVQEEVNRLLSCHELIVQNMRIWATKIANSHKYKYIYYHEKYGKECAVCHPHGGENHGWQCIGWAFAVWHHGGLPSKCNCGVIGDDEWEDILNAKTDAEALKIAQKLIGIKEIKVIRNKKGIPKSQTHPGDIGALYVKKNGKANQFQHVFFVMSDSKISDSSHRGGYKGDIKANVNFSGRYVSGLKVIIRYTGNGFTKPPKKTVDQLAHEVLEGKWGSGESRKLALNQCGYNYDAVQKRVDELLNPPKKTVNELALEVLDGKWGAGETRKKNLTKEGYNYNAVQKRVNEILAEREAKAKRKEEEAKLAKAKIEAKNSLSQYKTLEDYRDEQKQEIAQLINEGNNAIDAISSIDLIESTLTSFKEKLDMVKTDAQLSAEEEAQRIAEENLINQLAYEVLENKWGVKDDRKNRLTAAGYNYDKVQARVNEILTEKENAEKSYSGIIPSYHLTKSNAQVIADAVSWAKIIATNNNFHYGACNQHDGSPKPKKNNDKKMCSHHNGCYFCGTNAKMKSDAIVDKLRTYCCNPFVGAAWAHGGCVPKALELCRNGKSWDFGTGSGSYHTSSLFDNKGKLAKSKLKAGDVLCTSSHIKLYIGDGKVAEAEHRDDNVKGSSSWNDSIAIHSVGSYDRVYRFNSKVDTDLVMRHGEFGTRVSQWQEFLDWYFDGQVGKPYEGFFGDNTKKWTIEFQEKELGKGQGDGLVGPKTIEAAKKVRK